MPNDSSSLNIARADRIDEFYTRLEDIEHELWHYEEDFKDKTILCNCDDPYESNFFKYFAMNFNHFGLKKLIATCYDGSPIAGQELTFDDIAEMQENKRKAYKVELTSVDDFNHDGATDIMDVESLLKSDSTPVKLLDGNGDFKSEECMELLDEADIVVTNPPLSII